MSMMYDAVFRGRKKSKNKNHNRGRSNSNVRSCKYCGKGHSHRYCPVFGKKYQKCGKDNHFKAVCKSEKCNFSTSRSRPKKGKGKKFHEINEQKDEVMDNLADQVQSLFYHDFRFNSVNTRMHTLIECQTPEGKKSLQTFKIDTGADGNLMPISIFLKLFPKISLETLGRTINKGIMLFAYNNTQIKQYGTCSVKLSFKGRNVICKFFIVEH